MTSAPDIVAELQWRGLLYDATEGARDILRREKIAIYNGFDPTADSLHVGHLVPMLALARLQRYGHTPIALAGGGTGMIGDPSGRSAERNLLSTEEVAHNVSRIEKQLASILDFEVQPNAARVVNNADWLSRLGMMEFLRDVGKQFTVNYMLAKESVKSRLERDEAGISYTEFSYMLLQSYDFLHLFQHENCVMQAGGSDQWGNITAGVQLIRKTLGAQAYGISYPLLLKSDGTKFGKTASGSVWLDPEKTSPYRFYQFWFNADDDQVIQLLKFFTWLEREAIDELAHKVETEPERREAQRTLAQEVTRMIHGVGGLARAEQASEVLFGGEIAGLSAEEIGDIFADVPSSEVARQRLEGEGVGLTDLLVESGMMSSKGAAKRSIKGGGVYVNNVRATGAGQRISLDDAIEGRFVILRQGKRTYHLVRIQA